MIQRNVYGSNEYVKHFKPDQAHNPFRVLYAAKRDDIVNSVRDSLSHGGTVLDLGGGMGRLAVPLAQSYRVTLCDISGQMLQLAEMAARENRVPVGHLMTSRVDATKPLPFPSGKFDRALCIDLMVHMPNPVATLRELNRVLGRHGELLIDMTNSAPWWILRYPRYVGRRPNRWLQTWRGGAVLPEWQDVVRHRTRDQFVSMLSVAGFSIEQEWHYGPKWCPKWFLMRCRRQDR